MDEERDKEIFDRGVLYGLKLARDRVSLLAGFAARTDNDKSTLLQDLANDANRVNRSLYALQLDVMEGKEELKYDSIPPYKPSESDTSGQRGRKPRSSSESLQGGDD